MKTLRLAVASLVLVAACAESVVPIDEVANAPFDSALIGHWRQIYPDTSEAVISLSVFEFRAPEYYVEVVAEEGIKPSEHWEYGHTRARAYISNLAGGMFINADDFESKARPLYALFRYQMAGDTLTTFELHQAARKFTSSQQLREYITAHVQDGDMYQDTVKFLRLVTR